jgi:hydrogenase/urease accessory protein HupE
LIALPRGWCAVGVLVVCAAVWSSPARAHQQGVSYSEVTVADGRARYDLTLSSHDLQEIDADHDGVISDDEVLAQYPALRRHFEHALLVQAGGTPCPLSLQDFLTDPGGTVTFRLRGPCPDATPLRVAFQLLAISAAPGYDLAKITFRGTLTEHVFTRDDTTIVVTTGEGTAATIRRFFLLGVEHIATGYDHILFLLALLLVGGGLRALVGVVTAFTVAHSITLALATLDLVALPMRLVESAIALSIAWVALENVLFDQQSGRWRITFLFGLVHGFGFASVLRAMHLPSQSLAASLLAFNLGVEAGQIVIVLLAYPVIAAVQRAPQRRMIVATASSVIFVVALYWFVDRTFLA